MLLSHGQESSKDRAWSDLGKPLGWKIQVLLGP